MSHVSKAVNIADLRLRAKRRLPKGIFDFIDGGAEDEISLADNRAGFERIRMVPRVLVDVETPDLSTTVLGKPSAAPFVIAPMGSVAVAWPEADLILARAAAKVGIPYTMSTMSTLSVEDLTRQVDGRHWFQLYVMRDWDFNMRLIDRAAAAGCEALAVTVDTYVPGNRERNVRNNVTLPIKPSWRMGWGVMTHPAWALAMAKAGSPEFGNVRDLNQDVAIGFNAGGRAASRFDTSLDWDDLKRIRDRWPGKLMVKGVEHPTDAVRMVKEGVDAMWVSNHGGRQLDGAIATIDALPTIAEAVGDKVPIIIDSGVRRGVDAMKARALGAEACAVGRAALFGAAAGGVAGADRALEILTGELRTAMQLSGIAKVDDIDRDILASQGWPGA
ncbi:MAG: alpha-hydroxy acid oxidase [Alphaproteobacteria bacterium]